MDVLDKATGKRDISKTNITVVRDYVPSNEVTMDIVMSGNLPPVRRKSVVVSSGTAEVDVKAKRRKKEYQVKMQNAKPAI